MINTAASCNYCGGTSHPRLIVFANNHREAHGWAVDHRLNILCPRMVEISDANAHRLYGFTVGFFDYIIVGSMTSRGLSPSLRDIVTARGFESTDWSPDD